MSGPQPPTDPADQSWPTSPPGPEPESAWPTPPPGDPLTPPDPQGAWTPPPPRRGGNAGLVIAVVAVVAVAVVAACGVGGWFLYNRYSSDTAGGGGDGDTSQAIPGVKDYRADDPDSLSQDHQQGDVSYPMKPPAGGPHNPTWQNCSGDVYTEPVPEEMAVHSLEHGAVWITYSTDLDAAGVAKLASKVKGRDYMMLSPYPDQDKPISLQAWGYQLQLDSADDERIDKFIAKYRQEATMEPGAPCSGGNKGTGTPNAT